MSTPHPSPYPPVPTPLGPPARAPLGARIRVRIWRLLYGTRAPRRPLYADERFLGLTLVARLRLLLLMFALTLGLVVYVVVRSEQDRLDRRAAVDDRIAAANAATRDLACFVVKAIESQQRTRQGKAFVKNLSDRYSCAGYTPLPSLPSSSRPPSPTPQPQRTATPTGTAPQPQRPTTRPTATVTATRTRTTAPPPTAAPTVTRTTTAPAPTPTPSPTGGVVCRTVPLLCAVGGR